MNAVVVTLALVGLSVLIMGCGYIIMQLRVIHILVNSRLSEALNEIESLKGLLHEAKEDLADNA